MKNSILVASILFHSLGFSLALAQDPIEHAQLKPASLSQRFQDFGTRVREGISEIAANTRMNRRIVNQMETLAGVPILQEEHAANWSFFNYIAPNEVYGSYFEPCLPKEKGAYISVGTFRALNAGSSGKVAPLILFDFDRGTKLFNMVMLQCVAMSRDRYEMMSLLFTGKRHHDLIEKARAEKTNPNNFISELIARVRREGGGKVVENWKALGMQMQKEADWALFDNRFDRQLYSRIPEALAHFDRAETTGKTFLGNDTRFDTLKKLVLAGQVTAITGDLSDNKALTNLVKVMREKDIPVSAMDISNANDYFYTNDGHRNFVKNLKSLPFVPGGKFLFTEQDAAIPKKKPLADFWGYFSVPVDGIGNLEEQFAANHYFQAEREFTPDPGSFNDHGVLFTRDSERCFDEKQAAETLRRAAFLTLRHSRMFRRMPLSH